MPNRTVASILSLLTACAIAVTPNVLRAQTETATSGFSLGAAVIAGSSVYDGADANLRIFPDLSYKNGPWDIGMSQGVSYSFNHTSDNPISISLRPNFAPYSETDAPVLVGLKRDMTLDAVLGTKLNIARGTNISVKIGTEVTGKYDGHYLDVALSQFIPLFGRPMIFELGAKTLDQNRSNYAYGVTQAEATATRPAYDTGTTTTPYLGASTFFQLSDKLSGFVRLNVDILPKSIKNSPLVSGQQSVTLLSGLSYAF